MTLRSTPLRRMAGYLLGLASVAWATPVAIAAENAPPDLVVFNGKVLTVDSRFSTASAVAMRDGRFVAVGSDEEIRRLAGPSTRSIDARGHTVLPGLLETHVHPDFVVRGELDHPFKQMSSIAEIQDWIRDRVRDMPAGAWIQVPRVDVTRIRERRLPNRAELDEASPNRPVVFTWQYANRIDQILNTPALRIAGIGPDTKPLRGGTIDHDAQGAPTGRMENCGFLIARFLHGAGASPEERHDAWVRLFHRYNEIGITSITDRLTDETGLRTYQALEKAGRLSLRVTVTIALNTDGTVAGTEKVIKAMPFKTGDGDDWVRVGPLKIGVDGGSLYGTAYLREPYGPRAYSLYTLSDPNYRGDLRIGREQIKNIIRTGHRLGWQMASHVTGDAGVDAVLDGVEAANADSPIGPRRYNLIHAYFPDEATARRAASLGVGVDTQPTYYYKDADALMPALGPERVNRYIGLKTWVSAGVKVAINADHMLGFDPDTSLNPYNPFRAMQIAVTRVTEGGHVYGPEQKVTRQEALRMMTIDAAWLSFDENRKGSIEVGKLADLAILTGDFMACPENEMNKLRADVTIVDGKIVYDRSASAAGG
jgi:predicted amidohydrolase YtcJ